MRNLAAAVLLAVTLSGCVPASPDASTYDAKAAQTLGSAVSETRTVQRVLRTLYDGRMLTPTAVTQIRYSEKALSTATGAFTELNPPPTRDWLDSRAGSLLDDAATAMSDARVAVHRGEAGQFPGIIMQLTGIAAKLEALEGRVQ